MTVRDSQETIEVMNSHELEEFLSRRHEMDGALVNSFWMCHAEDWPALGILVRDNLACLDYMEDSEGTAFASQGEISELPKEGTTEFRLESQRQPVLNSHIVSFTDAVQAAKEFLHTKDLPKSIRWLQL